jgi:hypothetical protein
LFRDALVTLQGSTFCPGKLWWITKPPIIGWTSYGDPPSLQVLSGHGLVTLHALTFSSGKAWWLTTPLNNFFDEQMYLSELWLHLKQQKT